MICTGCREQKHWRCIDNDQEKTKTKGKGKSKVMVEAVLKEGRAYRSCNCQHKLNVITPKPEVSKGADE